jgi:hypothetical protein
MQLNCKGPILLDICHTPKPRNLWIDRMPICMVRGQYKQSTTVIPQFSMPSPSLSPWSLFIYLKEEVRVVRPGLQFMLQSSANFDAPKVECPKRQV